MRTDFVRKYAAYAAKIRRRKRIKCKHLIRFLYYSRPVRIIDSDAASLLASGGIYDSDGPAKQEPHLHEEISRDSGNFA